MKSSRFTVRVLLLYALFISKCPRTSVCMWPWYLTPSMTLILDFQYQFFEMVIFREKMVWLTWNEGDSGMRIHYCDVILTAIASQISSLTIVYSTVYSGTDQRKHQSCASLAFVRGIHRGPVTSPHKGPVTRKMFTFDDVIMWCWP